MFCILSGPTWDLVSSVAPQALCGQAPDPLWPNPCCSVCSRLTTVPRQGSWALHHRSLNQDNFPQRASCLGPSPPESLLKCHLFLKPSGCSYKTGKSAFPFPASFCSIVLNSMLTYLTYLLLSFSISIVSYCLLHPQCLGQCLAHSANVLAQNERLHGQ